MAAYLNVEAVLAAMLDLPATTLSIVATKSPENPGLWCKQPQALRAIKLRMRVQRALFLNGDDPRAAEAWLREKKLLRGQKADDPALTVNLDSGPAETSPFASGADAQPETAETGTGTSTF